MFEFNLGDYIDSIDKYNFCKKFLNDVLIEYMQVNGKPLKGDEGGYTPEILEDYPKKGQVNIQMQCEFINYSGWDNSEPYIDTEYIEIPLDFVINHEQRYKEWEEKQLAKEEELKKKNKITEETKEKKELKRLLKKYKGKV